MWNLILIAIWLLVNNLFKFINIGVDTNKLNQIVKTNIKFPLDYNLISTSVIVGYQGLDLTSFPEFKDDICNINVGKSSDDYIQYCVAEQNHLSTGHALLLIFMKK